MSIIKSFITAGAPELADWKNYGNVCQLSINYQIRQTAVKELHRILHPAKLFHSFASVIPRILFQQQNDGEAQQLLLVESSKGNATVFHITFSREEDKKHWQNLIRK